MIDQSMNSILLWLIYLIFSLFWNYFMVPTFLKTGTVSVFLTILIFMLNMSYLIFSIVLQIFFRFLISMSSSSGFHSIQNILIIWHFFHLILLLYENLDVFPSFFMKFQKNFYYLFILLNPFSLIYKKSFALICFTLPIN